MGKFDPETKSKIIVAIRKGATYEIACNYACVDYRSFRRWMVRGLEEKGTEYSQFRQDIKEAEGHTALIWLERIDKAAKDGAWQAAAWKLERRYFSTYGSNPQVREEMKELQKEFKNLRKKYGDNADGKIKELDKWRSEKQGRTT
jgi:hypothetical protein